MWLKLWLCTNDVVIIVCVTICVTPAYETAGTPAALLHIKLLLFLYCRFNTKSISTSNVLKRPHERIYKPLVFAVCSHCYWSLRLVVTCSYGWWHTRHWSNISRALNCILPAICPPLINKLSQPRLLTTTIFACESGGSGVCGVVTWAGVRLDSIDRGKMYGDTLWYRHHRIRAWHES